MTVALLLPVTYSLEPTAAFIMFAGIYYGGMYGGSTTSILLNTPGESSSIITAIEGNPMAKPVEGPRRSRPRPSAPSSPARRHRPAHPRGAVRRAARGAARAADYVALTVVALLTVSAARGVGVARPAALGSARCSGWSAPTRSPASTVHLRGAGAGRRHRRRDSSRSALRGRRGSLGGVADAARSGVQVGGDVDVPRRLPPLLEAVAARDRTGLPDRRHAGGRRRGADVPVVRGREEAVEAHGGVRHRARSRASPGRRRPTTRPPPACWCRC